MKRLAGLWLTLLVAAASCDVGVDHRRADGRVLGRGHSERRKNSGRWTLFHPDGSRHLSGAFVDGVPAGVIKTWYGNGRLQSQVTMRDRVPHGEAATFRVDGSRESAGAFRGGLRDGAWLFWAADGEVDPAATGWYRGGVRVE